MLLKKYVSDYDALFSYTHTKIEPTTECLSQRPKSFIFSDLITEVSAIFTFFGCKVTQ